MNLFWLILKMIKFVMLKKIFIKPKKNLKEIFII